MPLLKIFYALLPIFALTAPSEAQALFPTEKEKAALRAALVELETSEESNLLQHLTLNLRRGAVSSFSLTEGDGKAKKPPSRFEVTRWEDLGCGSIRYETEEKQGELRRMEIVDHSLRTCIEDSEPYVWEVSVLDDRGETSLVGNPRQLP